MAMNARTISALFYAFSHLLSALSISDTVGINLLNVNDDQLERWLFWRPNAKFVLFSSNESFRNMTEISSMGYNIEIGDIDSILKGCSRPQAPTLCLSRHLGGVVATGVIDPSTIPWTFTDENGSGDKPVFLKRRVDACPWCINGFFMANSNFIYLKPEDPLTTAALGLVCETVGSDEALTKAIKKFPRKASLVEIKHSNPNSRLQKRNALISTVSCLAATTQEVDISSAIRLHMLSSPISDIIKLETTSGLLECGGASGAALEHLTVTVADANRWLSTCRLVEFTEAVAKVRIKIAEHSAEVSVYRPASLVTVAIKTFERMDKAMQLVESINRNHPGVRVIVGDDGRGADKMEGGDKRGFHFVPLPYDVGLSQGRNILVKLVQTPYVLFLDDDFIVQEPNSLLLLLHELHSGKHDIVAAKSPRCDTDYSGKMRIIRSRAGGTKLLLTPQRDKVAGSTCERVDIVPNLFLAPAKLFQQDGLRWNRHLKLGEHEEFFMTVKRRGLRVATCPEASFDHWQTPEGQQTAEYRKMRERVWQFLEQFLRQRGLTELIAFGRSKARLQVLPRIKRLAQSPAALPFSVALEIETDLQPFPRALVEVRKAKKNSPVFMAHEIVNSGRLTKIDLPIIGLDPGRTYRVRVKPANVTAVDAEGPEIKVRTLPYQSNNLLTNGRFDGSMRGWRASLGSTASLISLFFPAHDRNYQDRRLKGKFHEHISGRPSAWAARNPGSRLDRNYAGVLMAPPTTSFGRLRAEHSLSQTISVKQIPKPCRQGSACQLLASVWVRVDKLWGEKDQTRLFLSIRLLDSQRLVLVEHRQALDPFLLEQWQYAVVQHEMSSLPDSTALIQFSVGLAAQVGSIYVDDAYLSARLINQLNAL